MKSIGPSGYLLLAALCSTLVSPCAFAQAPTAGPTVSRPTPPAIGVPVVGMPFVHDPSTVVHFHGRYYVYTTGRGAPFLSSPDGVTWTREGSVIPTIPDDVHAAVPKNNGMDVWAPDLVRVGGEFYLYYAVSSWGSFRSAVALATNPVLDPKDPAYRWTDRGIVVSSDGEEDLNAIDPGVILAPDGTLWICYGSYHGSIRVTQLDPKTGLALKPKALGQAIATARESEASDIVFHDGYYYLFVNHGSCCQGKNSQYNIRVGRSRSVTGPYLDRHGVDLNRGGGSLFLAAHDHRIGPGHFGRVLDYDASPSGADPTGAERFSIHYEADLTRGGRPTLDIRPLLWSVDGWPVAGDNLAPGPYQLVARDTENTLIEHLPTPSTAQAAAPAEPATPIVRLSRYLALDNERWTLTPEAATPFDRIVDVATGDALEVVDGAVKATAATGADAQLWMPIQLPDGGWRLLNKGSGLSLTSAAGGTVTATAFVRDDAHVWSITSP